MRINYIMSTLTYKCYIQCKLLNTSANKYLLYRKNRIFKKKIYFVSLENNYYAFNGKVIKVVKKL